LTGSFSLVEALGTFLWVAIGGIMIGAGVTWIAYLAKNWVWRRFGEETGSQILISLPMPYGAYLLAEHLHCSGILAAVAAGITMSYVEQSGQALAVTRVRRTAVWETAQFTANGIIFVLLGEQLPGIVTDAAQVVRETGHHEPVWLLIYVIAISGALAVLRFLWVWTSLRLVVLRATLREQTPTVPSWRLIAATSLAGGRGAVTLAGVMTLPLTLNDGSAFPARDLAIFLAAGVIIVSLIAASLRLPHLLRGLKLPLEPSYQEDEDRARIAAAEAAIQAVQQAQHGMGKGRGDTDLYADAGARIMELYRRRIDGRSKTGEEGALARRLDEIERQLRIAALRAERVELYRIARSRKLSDEITRKLVREVDLLEARFVTR
jgi:Na+/H+ antiporter